MNRRRLIAASLAVPALAPGALARMRTNEKITLGLINRAMPSGIASRYPT